MGRFQLDDRPDEAPDDRLEWPTPVVSSTNSTSPVPNVRVSIIGREGDLDVREPGLPVLVGVQTSDRQHGDRVAAEAATAT
jgi:hypothetical protein